MSKIKHWANRYISISKIGSGTFGTAYKVKDNSIPEGHGSIKVLKEIVVSNMDQDEIDECTREGKLLSKLSFPGIVQFFDSFLYGDLYCIITEFCEGGDLNDLIVCTKKQGSRLSEKRVLRWFIQLMLALNYIHKRKILHRDLKTRNIFLKNDAVKIGDFGISRILNCTMDMASTFVGTPFYMSPEVLKHDGYNAVSDVWSAGVILYELCALKHAYDAQGIMAVMYKIVEGPCPIIPEYYSKDLQNIVEKVMIKDPVGRPTAAEVLQMEYIQKTMNDPFLDLYPDTDFDETIIKSQTKDIQTYISETNSVKTLKDAEIIDTLTPKQKMDLKKKLKADQNAEEKNKVISKIYQENRETVIKSKTKSSIDSLPFSNRHFQKSLTSSYDEKYEKMKENCGNTIASGSKTVVLPKYKDHEFVFDQHNMEIYSNRHCWNTQSNEKSFTSDHPLNMTFTKPSQNLYNMYDINQGNIKCEDLSTCNVTTYNNCITPKELKPTIAEDIFYEDDFSSLSNGSQSEENLAYNDSELPSDTALTKFQDDEAKDPYGLRIKNIKIKNIERQCLQNISKDILEKALKFLDKNREKPDYGSNLRKICKSDNVAMLVDQLHFLKNPKSEIY